MARPPGVVPPDPPLTDGRVALRAARESDLQGLVEEGRDPETQRWVNVARPYTDRDARDDLERFTSWWDDPSAPFPLVIADADSDAYLGVIVVRFDGPRRIAELGYGVHPQARGSGIGTCAVRLAAQWAFAALGAERLEARTDPGNLASQRLLTRAGFTREGLERMSRVTNGVRGDMICWSLLPGDVADPIPSG
jgi:RimJ/RimL family protein N-acetyltransferase